MSKIIWKENSDIAENAVCGLLDATMDVVADFASMLANGICQFRGFRHCPDLILVTRQWQFIQMSN